MTLNRAVYGRKHELWLF